MKTLFAGFCSVTLATIAIAQGTLYVGNRFPSLSTSPIYGPEPNQPALSRSGQSSAGTPPGTIVYGGALLAGGGWTFATYAGPLTASENGLALVAMNVFGTGPNAGFISTHTIQAVPGVTVLQSAKYQIRVWDNQGGAISSWPQAVLAWEAGMIALGRSEVMISSRLGGTTNSVIYLPPPTVFNSFNVFFVPEPASAAMLFFALAALAMKFRRS